MSLNNKTMKNPCSDQDMFWIYEPKVLIENGNWYKIIPNETMSLSQKMNSLTLFIVYITILFFIFTKDPRFIFFGFVILFIIIIKYISSKGPCYQYCPKNDVKQETKPEKEINEEFETNDSNNTNEEINEEEVAQTDLFGLEHTNRQIYQVKPSLPSDQEDFARWLYSTPETCKENPAMCMINEDVRFHKDC